MVETLSGIVTAFIIIALCQVLSRYFTIKLLATNILTAIAFIYVGFALKNNTVPLIVLEIGVALVFYFISIIGYTRNGSLIAYGIILHGVWDICHHNGSLIKTNIAGYWPSYCFVIDIIDGLYFLFIFRLKNADRKFSGKAV